METRREYDQGGGETGADSATPVGRSSRFTQWCAFLVFSTIAMGAAIEARDDYTGDDRRTTNQKYAVAASSISTAITLIVVLMHLVATASVCIVGTKLEGILIVILIAFHAANVAVVSDSSGGLAVSSDGKVVKGNLYYFSWAGLVTSVTLFFSYLRSACHIDVAAEAKNHSARLVQWSAFLTCTLVVMASSASIYSDTCETGARSGKYCNRTLFALVLGCIGTLLALIVVAMKIGTGMAPYIFEAPSAVLLFASYAFGVAYITSQDGPGSPLGNLYYFSWLSFFMAFLLAASCYEDYVALRTMEEDTGGREEGEQHHH